MSGFHIQKRPVDVEVWTTHGDQPGVVQLSPFARLHGGAETVLDLMNGPEAFLPVISGRRVDLFAKSCIQALWCRESFEPLPGLAFVEHRVTVQLGGRKPFEVLLRDERPPGKERVSDILNDGAPFAVTFRDGGSLLIAKRHLVRVVPAVEGAAPAKKKKKKAVAKKRKAR